MIPKNYILALLISLGFFSICCAEENLSTFFDQLEEQVKELETKTNPPKKEIAPTQLVNTQAPEDHDSLTSTAYPKPVEESVSQDEKTTEVASQETTASTETTTVEPQVPIIQEEISKTETIESKKTDDPINTDSLNNDEEEIDLDSNEIE